MQPGDISRETRDRRFRRFTSVRLKTLAAVGAAVVVTQLGIATIASANESTSMERSGSTRDEAKANLDHDAQIFCASHGGLQTIDPLVYGPGIRRGDSSAAGRIICNK
jgi:hypothetical protein